MRAIQLHNEYAIDLTRRTPMDVTRGRGPRLFQGRVIHEAFCRIDEMPLHILLVWGIFCQEVWVGRRIFPSSVSLLDLKARFFA